MIPVTVAVQRGEHDAERASPLTEEDEEVMPQALLWKQEAPVVHWGEERKKKTIRSICTDNVYIQQNDSDIITKCWTMESAIW